VFRGEELSENSPISVLKDVSDVTLEIFANNDESIQNFGQLIKLKEKKYNLLYEFVKELDPNLDKYINDAKKILSKKQNSDQKPDQNIEDNKKIFKPQIKVEDNQKISKPQIKVEDNQKKNEIISITKNKSIQENIKNEDCSNKLITDISDIKDHASILHSHAYIKTIGELASFPEKFPSMYSTMIHFNICPNLENLVKQAKSVFLCVQIDIVSEFRVQLHLEIGHDDFDGVALAFQSADFRFQFGFRVIQQHLGILQALTDEHLTQQIWDNDIIPF